jgi:hypothetical protein
MEHLQTLSEISVQYRPKKAHRPKISTSSEAIYLIANYRVAEFTYLSQVLKNVPSEKKHNWLISKSFLSEKNLVE